MWGPSANVFELQDVASLRAICITEKNSGAIVSIRSNFRTELTGGITTQCLNSNMSGFEWIPGRLICRGPLMYRGTSLISNSSPQDPTVVLCLGPL